MCTQCLCTSTYFDAAGADENVLKEASENWKLEVIKNLESRTSMQRDPICSWKGCCLNFSLYFQYIFNIYIYVYYIYPYVSYDFYTFYTWFIPTGPLQDLQVASRPRDHCLATSRGSLIDVERGLVQWRVELDQAKAGPFCDMMSPLTFFRILKGLKVHFKSKWICFNSNHIVIFNYRVQGCYIC